MCDQSNKLRDKLNLAPSGPALPEEKDTAWVHAYLHRREGDSNNARYWYNRSGQPESKLGLDEEWNQIASQLLIKTQ